MAQIVLPTSDYTQLAKEYKLPNQKVSLWDQFLTGQQSYYQGLAQQVSDVASYDISQAYANYKQQQLQLQMSEQLGTGFKEQVGTQLQSQYGTAFQEARAQEASSLAEVQSAYQTALETGEEEFTELGKQLKTAETLASEYAQQLVDTAKTPEEAAKYKQPENAYRSYTDEQGNVITELTDYGRLWYSDVLGATTTDEQDFDRWLLSETSASTLDYEDREAFFEFYRQNPDLVRSQVYGLTSDFDYTETRTRLDTEERQTAWSGTQTVTAVSDALTELYGNEFVDISPENARQIQSNTQRNEYYVSTINNFTGKNGDVVTDSYGKSWRLVGYNKTGKDARKLGQSLGIVNSKGYISDTSKYKTGDVVYIDNNYYIITSTKDNELGIRQVTPGDYSYEGAVKPLF